MVVCKCRKATKLYCFVHKVPVCGECICFPEHQICVIRTYSEWVIDGDYDWPPKCCQCQDVIEDGTNSSTTRLGCLHVIHSNCLSSHIKSFPPHTAPAGYVCPLCSTSIWPPKSIKDSASLLHSKLKEAIIQTGMEKNLFGNHPVSLPEFRGPPPAFDSDPLVNVCTNGSIVGDGTEATQGYPPVGGTNIAEIDGSTSAANFTKNPSPVPGATTRKGAFHVDREENSYHTDDEDGKRKKYSRRGPFHHKFLRALLPFWSSALPTLPVTAPPRKDASNAEDVPESRQRQKSSRMDPRKILLIIAIIACMTTMGVLYYRLAQQGLGEQVSENEQL